MSTVLGVYGQMLLETFIVISSEFVTTHDLHKLIDPLIHTQNHI